VSSDNGDVNGDDDEEGGEENEDEEDEEDNGTPVAVNTTQVDSAAVGDEKLTKLMNCQRAASRLPGMQCCAFGTVPLSEQQSVHHLGGDTFVYDLVVCADGPVKACTCYTDTQADAGFWAYVHTNAQAAGYRAGAESFLAACKNTVGKISGGADGRTANGTADVTVALSANGTAHRKAALAASSGNGTAIGKPAANGTAAAVTGTAADVTVALSASLASGSSSGSASGSNSGSSSRGSSGSSDIPVDLPASASGSGTAIGSGSGIMPPSNVATSPIPAGETLAFTALAQHSALCAGVTMCCVCRTSFGAYSRAEPNPIPCSA
jgi:hypothetical protein